MAAGLMAGAFLLLSLTLFGCGYTCEVLRLYISEYYYETDWDGMATSPEDAGDTCEIDEDGTD